MVLYEVFSHSIKKRYKTSIFSKASIVQLISIVLTYLSPFLIAYFTGGFWLKQKSISEQPKISFQYRFIALLEGSSSYLTSSFENINQIYSNEFRPSVRTISEIDSNDDGYNDLLELSIFVSGIPPMVVTNLKLLLLFNTSLSAYSDLKFESIGYLDSYNSRAATEVSFDGELRFVQNANIREKVKYDDYSYQLLNHTNLDLEALNLNNIIREYSSRGFSTKLDTDYVSWSNSLAEGFKINAHIRYPPFKINYIPAFWEQFKWGWIQYICVLIPFLFVFKMVKIFIFENQLVPTIAISVNQKIKSS